MENLFPRSVNDSVSEMALADSQCSNSQWDNADPRSCIPLNVPNIVQCVYSVIKTLLHIIGNLHINVELNKFLYKFEMISQSLYSGQKIANFTKKILNLRRKL